MIENINYFEKRKGVDVGKIGSSNLSHPDFPDSKKGYPKIMTLNEILNLAKILDANIIIKAGDNAKWYIKKVPKENIEEEIEKQKWRNTKTYTMYIVEFQ